MSEDKWAQTKQRLREIKQVAKSLIRGDRKRAIEQLEEWKARELASLEPKKREAQPTVFRTVIVDWSNPYPPEPQHRKDWN